MRVAVMVCLLLTGCAANQLRLGSANIFSTRAKTTAWNEIWGALISFMLCVGATKGHWIENGGLDFGFGANLGAGIFGFITIIWVALALYIVSAKTKSDAKAAARKAGAIT